MRRLILTLLILNGFHLRADSFPVRAGATFTLNGKKAEVTQAATSPCVQNEYTKRFHFDSADNPKLSELRNRYHLDTVVASAPDEFHKQILLNDWAHRQFKKFGHPSDSARGALEILDGIHQGQSYFCAQYAELLVSAAASLGWNDRLLALRRHQGVNAHGGSTEHTSTEIWSNQYAKWIMLDPTSNMYLEKNGMPLNAWEIREEWFYHQGTNLTFVVGKNESKYHKSDLPVFLERFADFGDLTIDPDELDKYGFIGYIPNTNLMDAGDDYGQMFITKDKLCDGTKWHERLLPAHPDVDPYFPINESSIELSDKNNRLDVSLKTFMPNFKTFERRIDGTPWGVTADKFEWEPHSGANRLECRSVNAFGVYGPVSSIEITIH